MSDLSTPTILQRPRRLSKLRFVALVVLAIVAGFVLIWAWEYWAARSQYLAAVATVRERGESLDLNEIVERLIKEQPVDSGAALIARATDLDREMDTHERIGDDHPDVSDFKSKNPEPRIAPNVQKRIAGAAEVVRLLEEATKRPVGLTLKPTGNKPAEERAPRAIDPGSLGRLLYWVSYDALARDDGDLAYRAVWLRFALDEQWAHDPGSTSQIMRLSRFSQTCEHLALCLPRAALNERRFRQLDAELTRWDDGFRVEPCLRFERAAYLARLEDPKVMREDVAFQQEHWGPKDGPEAVWRRFWMELYLSPIGRPTMLREKTKFLHLMDVLLSTVDRPDADWSEAEKAIKRFIAGSAFSYVIGSEFLTGGASIPMKAHQGASGLNSLGQIAPNAHRKLILARLALRLRRHYDVHGRFPERLDELCDEAMPKIRLDWFQNLPLVYVPRADGFLLDVSPKLKPGPGYSLKRNDADPHTIFAWDFKLKTTARHPPK